MVHLTYIQCFSSSHVISTATLRSRAQRGYVAWVPDLNMDVLIPEPARGIIPPCFLKSSNPIKGPLALSLTHTLTPLPPDGTAGGPGFGSGSGHLICVQHQPNSHTCEPGRCFRLLHTQNQCFHTPRMAHTIPTKPSPGGHSEGRAEKGRMLSPHYFTFQNLP